MNTEWWSEEYGFFGEYYLEGDNSHEGYLIAEQQTLEQRTFCEVEGVITLLNLASRGNILDIPSGYGRHSIGLAKRGFNVVGSELNSTHLHVARAAAQKENVQVDFVQENMIDIKYQEKFDAVVNMFYSFGFFGTEEDNNRVLENFYNALKPGGKFLFHTDVNMPRILSGKYKENETRKLVSGKTLRISDVYNPKDKRIYGSWIISNKEGKEIKRDYSVRVYDKEEFIKLCETVGFKDFEVYGDWNKTPYSEESEDMIIIGKK
jgi:SAM-dependent methyltransferase